MIYIIFIVVALIGAWRQSVYAALDLHIHHLAFAGFHIFFGLILLYFVNRWIIQLQIGKR